MAKVVVQRVRSASVSVDGVEVGRIGQGLLILLGIRQGDAEGDVERLADKTVDLRIFSDADGKMNLSSLDVEGGLLVVSQFTLYADVRKGRRPSFTEAAPPEEGDHLYRHFIGHLEKRGLTVERGEFGAHMLVSLANDGPVTIIIDSADLRPAV